MRSTNRQTQLPLQFASYIVLLVISLFSIIPLYWMIVAASLRQSEFLTLPPQLVPGTHFIENLSGLLSRFPYLTSVWNSVYIAVIYTIISVVLCSLAGFAFAKYDFKYQGVLFYFILSTLVLPLQALIIPMYIMMASLNLLDTHIALILPFLANPIGIFLMRQSMMSIPDSWLDAARTSGASEFQIFYRVVLPAMKPMLASLAVILFLLQWNAFLYPLVILESESLFTIPLAIEGLTGHHRLYFHHIMAASTIAILPMVVLFLWLQKHFIRGFKNTI